MVLHELRVSLARVRFDVTERFNVCQPLKEKYKRTASLFFVFHLEPNSIQLLTRISIVTITVRCA